MAAYIVLVLVVASICSNVGADEGSPTPCPGELNFLDNCGTYISPPAGETKGPPSVQCCNAAQQADLLCICEHGIMANEGEMERFVNLASYCKRPLVSGTQCGDYTVPKVKKD